MPDKALALKRVLEKKNLLFPTSLRLDQPLGILIELVSDEIKIKDNDELADLIQGLFERDLLKFQISSLGNRLILDIALKK